MPTAEVGSRPGAGRRHAHRIYLRDRLAARHAQPPGVRARPDAGHRTPWSQRSTFFSSAVPRTTAIAYRGTGGRPRGAARMSMSRWSAGLDESSPRRAIVPGSVTQAIAYGVVRPRAAPDVLQRRDNLRQELRHRTTAWSSDRTGLSRFREARTHRPGPEHDLLRGASASKWACRRWGRLIGRAAG